ncbi:MAG: clan AA aspartic protease [Bacteroidales bacterium]|nr:clan AA aspartic protease [Bacteroidales bacterium]
MATKIPIQVITLEEGSYHIFVRVHINGREANFIVDTGASKTVVDWNISDLEFYDNKPSEKLHAAAVDNGQLKTRNAKLSSLQIGNIFIRDLEVAAIDLSHINKLYSDYSDAKISGLLGSDFLYKHKVIINFGNSTITIE